MRLAPPPSVPQPPVQVQLSREVQGINKLDQRHRLWSDRATEQNPAQAEARQANYDDSTPHQVVDSGLTGGRNDTSRFTKWKPIVYPGKSEGKVANLFYKDN